MAQEATPTVLSDVHLARAAASDKVAAERLLTRVFPKIHQVIRSVVPHSNRMDDIGQIVAVEVLQSLRNYQGAGTLEAWVGQIAFRTAMHTIKKQREWDNMHTVIDEVRPAAGPNPERTTARRELCFSLHQHLDTIPPMRRTPLLLHLVYGHTVREVSEIVGVPENTVKDRLKTAVRELREILNNNPGLKQAMLEVIS